MSKVILYFRVVQVSLCSTWRQVRIVYSTCRMSDILAEAVKGAAAHPRPEDIQFAYGTAGFRDKSTILDPVLYRMGLLAALRSKAKKATVAVMITASHNPEPDNGVKLVDPMGEMLEGSWEKHATDLANAKDEDIGSALQRIIDAVDIDISLPSDVFVARDTRPSGPPLTQALLDGLKVMGSTFTDFGILTTPQLHYLVRCHNSKGAYGEPTEEGYYKKLAQAFLKLRKDGAKKKYEPVVIIDGANGVGALKTRKLQSHLHESLRITVCNDGSSGKLNEKCGADFVKVQQKPPAGLEILPGQRCVSFDGDADRVVFFYLNKDGVFNLLDGDKISTLIAGYLGELVSASGLQLNIGVVQTAYANGSSTRYLEDVMKVPVSCAKTGVKHLHHKALEFDVGVYFEANGHGTVLFSDQAEQKIKAASQDDSLESSKREAATRLTLMMDLINQTVGDAISDFLVVETILSTRDWAADDWNMQYRDLPSRLLKIKVKDRTAVQTTDAERCATAPAGLQEAINKLVAKYQQGRSFVRPSGTEDVVRVFAEADTQANADMLAHEVSVQVYQLAGGVGDQPQPPCAP
ncbi:phosphoacetylglucosamine mutase-like isoform X2 [Branchiostoma floridae x Branchiostoma japonicum]